MTALVSSNPISVRRAHGRVVVSVRGPLDWAGADFLERVLVDLIDGQGNRDVVVELAGVDIDDPQVEAALGEPAERARRRGAAFGVAGTTGRRVPLDAAG